MSQSDRQNLHDRLLAVIAPSSLPERAVFYAKRAVFMQAIGTPPQFVKWDLERAKFFAENVRLNVLGQFILDLKAVATETVVSA